MNRKYKLAILIGLFSLSVFLFSDAANAQVRIDNFNVIQRTIPSTASSIDFRLTISQQDQNLDCLPLIPLTNGSLQWAVWYEVPGYTTFVRRQEVALPLSPTTKNLDFSESIKPTARAVQSGGMSFKAALGCQNPYLYPSTSLAVSSPIRVSVSGGPGGPGEPGPGQPGDDVDISFNIPNPIQAESLIDLAKAIGRFLFQIAIPIAVIIIIYAGLLFLTSRGDKEKITTARKALWYAVIGLAIILIGQGFFTLIKSILDLGG